MEKDGIGMEKETDGGIPLVVPGNDRPCKARLGILAYFSNDCCDGMDISIGTLDEGWDLRGGMGIESD